MWIKRGGENLIRTPQLAGTCHSILSVFFSWVVETQKKNKIQLNWFNIGVSDWYMCVVQSHSSIDLKAFRSLFSIHWITIRWRLYSEPLCSFSFFISFSAVVVLLFFNESMYQFHFISFYFISIFHPPHYIWSATWCTINSYYKMR